MSYKDKYPLELKSNSRKSNFYFYKRLRENECLSED